MTTQSALRSLSRRSFLAATATSAAALVCTSGFAAERRRKRIAFIGTEVRRHSHAQHFLDRLLMGYTWGGAWRIPDIGVASIYIDQFPENDLARGPAKQFGVPIYPTISEALTPGSSKLPVNGGW